MAVIQISKMQVRRGQTLQTGFPQLSSGELGWSIDKQELYIGNGSVTEGAPAVGNTQLITEHNVANFFLVAERYQYPAQNTRLRSIEDKLNDVLTLKDFGDVSTVTDHTLFIQNAISESARLRVPLIFPEGNYTVTATIRIPPLAEIRGAGTQKTIISNISTASTFQTIDGSNRIFGDGGFAVSGSPRNVKINGITFVNSTTNALPIMQLDCVADSVIEHCEFIGNPSVSSATSVLAQAVNFRDITGYPSNKTSNVQIKECVFHKLSSAIVSDYDISDITISENKFNFMDRGIVLGEILTGQPDRRFGPQTVLIENNTFDYINRQAIVGGSTSTNYASDINSVNNYFFNVGNNGRGDTTSTQVTEVIKFNSFGNYSHGDTFDRVRVINTGTTYGLIPATAKSLVDGPVSLRSKGTLVRNIVGIGSQSDIVFVYPRSSFQYGTNPINQLITIEYTINKPTRSLVRRGTLEILVTGTTAQVKDTYTGTVEEFDGNGLPSGAVFTAVVNSTKNLVIVYINNLSGTTGNILFTYTVRQ